jgi:hypothetical protein
MENKTHDVIVVGGGNAALCAARAANEQGARSAPRAVFVVWRNANNFELEMLTRATRCGSFDVRALDVGLGQPSSGAAEHFRLEMERVPVWFQ